MLRELSIRNFAIIDDLRISFAEGLTILSGETGAGKSIIVNAINLLLGSRAAGHLVRSDAENAELEAFFQISARSSAAAVMAQKGYDPGDGLLVRRIISREDSNRIYINGQLGTVQILSAITENLASISGQHAHQMLLQERHHLDVLDRFGGLAPERIEYSQLYRQLLPLCEELEKLHRLNFRQAEQVELLKFQETEIAKADISLGEDDDLEHERSRLRNAEALYQTVYACLEAIYSAQGSIVERLGEVGKQLARACDMDKGLRAVADDIAQATYLLEDKAEVLRNYMKGLHLEESRLEMVEARLDALNKLKRKFGTDLGGILQKLVAIRQDLESFSDVDEQIKKVESRIQRLLGELSRLADSLSQRRHRAAEGLSRAVEAELRLLKMGHTRFAVQLEAFEAGGADCPHMSVDGKRLTDTGWDRALFLIAPNVGENLKPLASIASGGELSRLVLALKAIVASSDAVETVVFDEVDAGIGGAVAERVGKKLAELSARQQIICITHLPQIAKFGNRHFRIDKRVVQGRTKTRICLLEQQERVHEIARMLGGEKLTEATLAHAREMLQIR